MAEPALVLGVSECHSFRSRPASKLNFWRLRWLMVTVDAREVLQFSTPCRCIQSFNVAALALFQRRIYKDFDELAGWPWGCEAWRFYAVLIAFIALNVLPYSLRGFSWGAILGASTIHLRIHP